ncbi:hypothetical protein C9890_0202 [Perkinsus sp. BL_2016]|nr:hypothetical protein C9890_0202 [Perkinsus sp. BL_2016]
MSQQQPTTPIARPNAWGSDGSNDAAVRCWGRCHHDSWLVTGHSPPSHQSPRVMCN